MIIRKGFLLFFLLFAALLNGQEGKQKDKSDKNRDNLSLGFETLASYNIYKRVIPITGNETKTVYPFKLDLTLMPTLHIQLEDNFEVAPYILGRYEGERDEDFAQNSNPEVYKDLNRLSFGAGCGLYWKFIDTNLIDMHTGFRVEIRTIFPSWGESAPTGFYNFDPGTGALTGLIDIPLTMEINPFGNFRIRLWLKVLRFSLLINENYFRDNIIEQSISVFSSSPFWENDTQAVSLSLIFPLGKER